MKRLEIKYQPYVSKPLKSLSYVAEVLASAPKVSLATPSLVRHESKEIIITFKRTRATKNEC